MSRDIVHIHLWYDDGRRWNGPPSAWNEAPSEGLIQGLALFSDGRAQTMSGYDLWWLQNTSDGWILANDNDRDSYLRRFCPNVKWGRWTPLHKVEDAHAEARRLADGWRESHSECGCN